MILSDKSSVKIYSAITAVVILLIINAFTVNYFTEHIDGESGIDMDNLAGYTVSKTNLMYDDIPTASDSDSSDAADSSGKLLYPTDCPYFIEIDKTNQVVTVFTTSSTGKYDKPVRIMLCSTPEKSKRFVEGYWKMSAIRATEKDVWRTLQRYGQTVYAQYVTPANGFLFFQSVPYSDSKKEKLDQMCYDRLGSPDPEGSVILTVENAKWISENCKAGTWIHITDNKKNPSLTKALREQLPMPDITGWDPTDPDPKNPNYHPQYTEDTPEPEGYLVDNRGLDKLEKGLIN